MPKGSLEHQEMVSLLARLKEETPEYPTELLEARKHSFLKQIVDLQISTEKQNGGNAGPGKSGRPGAALRGGSAGATLLGISLKTALAIGAAILMLTAGYLFRDQIVEALAEAGLIRTEETAAPPLASTPAGPRLGTPTFEGPAAGGVVTEAAPGSGTKGPGETPPPTGPEGPASIFRYLICILQSGSEACQ